MLASLLKCSMFNHHFHGLLAVFSSLLMLLFHSVVRTQFTQTMEFSSGETNRELKIKRWADRMKNQCWNWDDCDLIVGETISTGLIGALYEFISDDGKIHK